MTHQDFWCQAWLASYARGHAMETAVNQADHALKHLKAKEASGAFLEPEAGGYRNAPPKEPL